MPDLVGGVPFWLLKAVALAVGASFGSFSNVLIHRVPRGESVVSPGSRCPGCGAPIAWYDNVPILSWVLLLGRCRRCKAPISIRYFLVELCVAVLSLACLYLAIAAAPPSAELPGIAALWAFPFAFCLLLVVIAFVDLEHWRIPPALAVPGAVLGVAGAVALGDLRPPTWSESLIGLAAGGLGLAALVEVWYLVTKREGMGYGDVLLLGMIGATIGWKALPFVLLAASVQGLVVTVPLLIAGRRATPPWEAETAARGDALPAAAPPAAAPPAEAPPAEVPPAAAPPAEVSPAAAPPADAPPAAAPPAAAPPAEAPPAAAPPAGAPPAEAPPADAPPAEAPLADAPPRKVLHAPIPFGPFLALGALEWLFFGDLVVGLLVP
ncbi:MAG: prepilin peptidase [Deltaproteobacteria bacterium]|nr:prepilin peptidase [Deltaproteobacteria bacterium]